MGGERGGGWVGGEREVEAVTQLPFVVSLGLSNSLSLRFFFPPIQLYFKVTSNIIHKMKATHSSKSNKQSILTILTTEARCSMVLSLKELLL